MPTQQIKDVEELKTLLLRKTGLADDYLSLITAIEETLVVVRKHRDNYLVNAAITEKEKAAPQL